LLIAGGVGINPLWSMMQYVADAVEESLDFSYGRTSLLYSASGDDELLFKVKCRGYYECNILI
jgi:ferredoxin-NADP reductase